MAQNRFWKLFDLIIDSFAVLGGILILLVTLFVTYSVTHRYLHYKPPIWILQCTEYALLWLTFLGAAWLLKKDGHIRIDTIVRRFRPKGRLVFDIIVACLGCIVCIIIFWFGVEKTIDLYQRGIMDVKGVTMPQYPLFLVIPLGGLLLLIQFIRNLSAHLKTLSSSEA